MDCHAIERYEEIPRNHAEGWRVRLVKLLHAGWSGYPVLDLETMSDHMKRDMGFMDGRGPRQGSRRTR